MSARETVFESQGATPRKPDAEVGAGNPKKGRGLVRSGNRNGAGEGFAFVRPNQAVYPVTTMCRVLAGTMLADMVAILGSIDIVIPEIDR